MAFVSIKHKILLKEQARGWKFEIAKIAFSSYKALCTSASC